MDLRTLGVRIIGGNKMILEHRNGSWNIGVQIKWILEHWGYR